MLRRLAIESGIVLALTTMLLALAATAGLPGRRETSQADAAGEVPARVVEAFETSQRSLDPESSKRCP